MPEVGREFQRRPGAGVASLYASAAAARFRAAHRLLNRRVVRILCALALPTIVAAAEGKAPPPGFHHDVAAQLASLRDAVIALPVATLLGAVLAFRPRRRATRAVVMLVVGASLARAFGIVGATGLVRYRAKIDDPKDAGVMLSTLGIGLASGVGLHLLAGFATVRRIYLDERREAGLIIRDRKVVKRIATIFESEWAETDAAKAAAAPAVEARAS